MVFLKLLRLNAVSSDDAPSEPSYDTFVKNSEHLYMTRILTNISCQ